MSSYFIAARNGDSESMEGYLDIEEWQCPMRPLLTGPHRS
jgi:hypothetical protein